MQFSTTALTLAGLLAVPASAMFDAAACSGIGACTQPDSCNWWPSEEPSSAEWDCGSAGTITGQVGAGAELNFEKGLSADGAQVVDAKDFPVCDLVQPPTEAGKATLLKSVYEGVTVYGWIEYSCTATTPIVDQCYSTLVNLSKTWTCKVYKDGQACTNIDQKLASNNDCPK